MIKYKSIPAKIVSLKDRTLAAAVAGYIRIHAFEHPELLRYSLLSKRFGVCSTRLKTAFASRYQVSIHGFIMKLRHEKICELITGTNLSLKIIAFEAGYTELSNFSRDFTKMAGVSPTVYRQQQKLKIHNSKSIMNTLQESS